MMVDINSRLADQIAFIHQNDCESRVSIATSPTEKEDTLLAAPNEAQSDCGPGLEYGSLGLESLDFKSFGRAQKTRKPKARMEFRK